jgi:hypothetical protein
MPVNTDQELFELLCQRRTEIGIEQGITVMYQIANNDTLRQIALRRPRNSTQLLQVNGIGPTALARFGADWIAVVRDFEHEEAAKPLAPLDRRFWLIVGKAVLLPYQEVQDVLQWAEGDTPDTPASLRTCFWNIVKAEAFRRQDNENTNRVNDSAETAIVVAEQIEDAVGGNVFDVYSTLKNEIDIGLLPGPPANEAVEKLLEYLFWKGIQTDAASPDGTFINTVTLDDLLAGRDQEDPFV